VHTGAKSGLFLGIVPHPRRSDTIEQSCELHAIFVLMHEDDKTLLPSCASLSFCLGRLQAIRIDIRLKSQPYHQYRYRW
jgi:hypothetical protein